MSRPFGEPFTRFQITQTLAVAATDQTPTQAISTVADRCGVTVDCIMSENRTRKIARARHVAMMALRRRGMSLNSVARWLNRKDHTTICHGEKVIAKLLEG